MDQKKLKKINYELVDTFLSAGKLSLELRRIGLKKEIKDDQTPVTNGDLEVDKILTEKITNLTPEIPIVSEESSKNKLNTKLKNFWLIDPIDGTYDYINNGDEFTLSFARTGNTDYPNLNYHMGFINETYTGTEIESESVINLVGINYFFVKIFRINF